LSLGGAATLAQYEAALRTITYNNTSDNPSTQTRTVSFVINDGQLSNTLTTRDIFQVLSYYRYSSTKMVHLPDCPVL